MFKYMLAAVIALVCTPALAQDFKADRVITNAEAEPGVRAINDWSAKLYPAFKLKYSVDINATQAQGFIPMKGSNRVIALLISQFLSTGGKATEAPMGQYVSPAISDKALDLIRAASYPENGSWETVSMGNLNDTPGRVLVGLVQSGAKLPTPGGGNCSCSIEFNQGWNAALDAASRLRK